jgi:hypothetical protein
MPKKVKKGSTKSKKQGTAKKKAPAPAQPK